MRPLTVLFISSEFKGEELIRSVKAQGCFTLLLVEEKLREKPWPPMVPRMPEMDLINDTGIGLRNLRQR